jgi:hypothetical protein
VADHRQRSLPPTTSWWRRVWKDRRLMHHNRLAAAVLGVNALVGWRVVVDPAPAAGPVATAVLVNVMLATLVRQQRVINLLFALATAAPRSWPLRVRWTLGKVYHFGGIHVGAATAATVWSGAAAVLVTRDGAAPGVAGTALVVLSWTVLVLLGALLVTAAPRLRARFHDRFELVHRFGGWAALALFGAHALLDLAVTGRLTPRGALASPTVWGLGMILLSVASTWFDLRRVPVTYSRPSRHVAIARFTHRTPFAGSSTALSRNPLREWHHFANVPSPGRDGFRLTVSRAGDWTGSLIDDLPDTVWVKGIPTAGVGNIDKLFRKVLWVATGSGIGPCLPHLLAGSTPAALVWSTREPRATYGDELVAEILAAQPEAVIWDTTTQGKPDLVRLAFACWNACEAEAVICISNKPTTWSIVEAFERRGVPAYGAIWDS